jgi:hypothetical protein
MTKAALCVTCADIVSPYRSSATDGRWRRCECGQAGVRWRNSVTGQLEVTSEGGPDNVRVIGINNMFLQGAVGGYANTPRSWRELHEHTCRTVEPHYLFHQDNRNCWALIVAVGESGDVTFVRDTLGGPE